jgi:hypothetical protein
MAEQSASAKCFTSTTSFGWHHLTSISRDDLNAAHDVPLAHTGGLDRLESILGEQLSFTRGPGTQPVALPNCARRAGRAIFG